MITAMNKANYSLAKLFRNHHYHLMRNLTFLVIGLLIPLSAMTQRDRDQETDVGPVITLWKVDKAHMENHDHGESYYLACGAESYIRYQGAGTSEESIIVIKNEGTRNLRLKLPLAFEDEKRTSYTITHQPEKSELAPNEETHFVVTYTAPDEYINEQAAVRIQSNDPATNTCMLNFDVGVVGPDFTKEFTPNVIGPGAVSTLTFTIQNFDGTPVTDLAFTDVLPAGMTIAAPGMVSTTCSDAIITAPDGGGTITMTDGRLGPNSSCTVTVNVTSSTPGLATNTTGALSSSVTMSGAIATDDLTVDVSRPGFTKSFSPNPVLLGERSTLTFTIDNSLNASPIGSIDFTDILPVGMEIASPSNASTDCISPLQLTTLTAIPGSQTIILNADGSSIGSNFVLLAGETCTATVDVKATSTGTLENITNELTSTPNGFNPLNSSGKATDELEVTRDDLHIQKEFVDDPLNPGESGTLLFTITNFTRDQSATNISFTDNLGDAGGTLLGLAVSGSVTSDCGGTTSGTTTFSLNNGTLAPEATCTIEVPITVPPGAAPGQYPNTTTSITADLGGSMYTGSPASDILFVSDAPTLTKTFLDNPETAGATTRLQFTITNNSSTSSATDINFIDNLPEILPTAMMVPASGFCNGTGDIIYTPLIPASPPSSVIPAKIQVSNATLMPGASCTFDVTLDIAAEAPSGIYTNTTEPISATINTQIVTGEVATTDLSIIAAPQITKTFTDDPVAPGNPVTLQFTLTNSPNNPTDATGITFTDDLPPVLSGLVATGLPVNDVCGTGSSLTGSMGNTLLTFAGGTLMPGEDCTFSVTLDVPVSATPGTYTNNTSGVTATVGGTSVSSSAATAELKINPLTFTKEFVENPFIPGESGTLRFTLDLDASATQDATITFFTDALSTTLSGLT